MFCGRTANEAYALAIHFGTQGNSVIMHCPTVSPDPEWGQVVETMGWHLTTLSPRSIGVPWAAA